MKKSLLRRLLTVSLSILTLACAVVPASASGLPAVEPMPAVAALDKVVATPAVEPLPDAVPLNEVAAMSSSTTSTWDAEPSGYTGISVKVEYVTSSSPYVFTSAKVLSMSYSPALAKSVTYKLTRYQKELKVEIDWTDVATGQRMFDTDHLYLI